MSGLASWRTALRIARRESRRAKGRAALVIAMLALPVLALTFAAVTYDMFELTPTEKLDREIGAADARLQWVSDGPVRQEPTGDGWIGDGDPNSRRPATMAEVTALLPTGSRAVPAAEPMWRDVRTAAGVGNLEIRGLDVGDSITQGMVSLRSGRAPGNATEAVATEAALRRLGSKVGGTFALADGSRTYTIVGVAEFSDRLGEVLAVPPAGLPEPVNYWLVKVPGGVNWDLVKRLNQRGLVAKSRMVTRNPPPASESPFPPSPNDNNAQVLGVGVLIGGLGVLEVVFLAGPAFAVSVRRRRRDLALVAAAGGTPAHLRRIVLADGVVLGLVGAVTGLAVGVVAATAGRPLVEQYLFHTQAGGYRFFPLALLGIAAAAVLTGMLAALVPAYIAARQDVVAGLTGRRGAVRSRRRWLVTGLVLTAGGTGLAAYGAAQVGADIILAGLICAEVGLALCTPSLIGLLARFGRLLPLAPRIALRDAGRNRAAAAPAISAIMAAVAASVTIGVTLVSGQARTEAAYQATLPAGYLAVVTNNHADTDAAPVPVPLEKMTAAASDLPVTGLAEIREATCPAGATPQDRCSLYLVLPPERECPYFRQDWNQLSDQDRRRARADERCKMGHKSYMFLNVVDDGRALPFLTAARADDVTAATATLKAGGVVVTDPRYVRDGQVTVQIDRSSSASAKQVPQGWRPGPAGGGYPDSRQPTPPAPTTMTVPGYALTSGLDAPRGIFSPGLLSRTGLATQQAGFVLATSTAPDTAQQDRFTAAVREVRPDVSVTVERGWPFSKDSRMMIVLTIAAGLITLGAAGIATGLAAADGRADLSTLASVGASPRVRRTLSLSQSGLIAGLGTVLGIAAGLTAAFAILGALNQQYATAWPIEEPYPLRVPWNTLGVLVVVPLVAMLGAGLLTQSRLPIERRRE